MVLCGDGNLAELIRPGTTVVEVDKSIHGPACGLVALKAPAKVTTTGLTWDCGTIVCLHVLPILCYQVAPFPYVLSHWKGFVVVPMWMRQVPPAIFIPNCCSHQLIALLAFMNNFKDSKSSLEADTVFSGADNLTLEVGGMQSTSNRLKDDEITVTTDQPLIWTVEFRDGSPE